MSWSLSASGHAETPDSEKALAQSVGRVLADAGQEAGTVMFYGSNWTGDPRTLAAVPDGDEQA